MMQVQNQTLPLAELEELTPLSLDELDPKSLVEPPQQPNPEFLQYQVAEEIRRSEELREQVLVFVERQRQQKQEALQHQLAQRLEQVDILADGINALATQLESEILHWIVTLISELLDVPIHKINVREPISSFCLNWVEAAIVAGDLENYLARDVSPTIAYDYPTIETLAKHLAKATNISV